MRLDRMNYEEWALDFLEGSLSPEEHQAFVLFLEKNPDLQEEFQGFDELNPSDAPVGVFDKTGLKRSMDVDAALDLLEAKTRLARPLIYLPHGIKQGLKKGSVYPWKKIISIAASLTLLVSLGTNLLNTPNGEFTPRTPHLDIHQEKIELEAIPAAEAQVVKPVVKMQPKAEKSRTFASESRIEVQALTPKNTPLIPSSEIAMNPIPATQFPSQETNRAKVVQVGNYLLNNPEQIPAVALGLGKKLLEERSWYKQTPNSKEFDLGFVRIKRS